MAYRDNITDEFDGEINTMRGFNVSATVGIGGKNDIGDVMLIQAMFKYIASVDNFGSFYGMSKSKVPEPSGVYGDSTRRAILRFQERKAYKLLKVDGIIHPASFEGRTLDYSGKHMCITVLNSRRK